jgi:CHAT domain-containing protein
MKDNIFEEVQTFVTTLETSAAMRKDKRAELIKAGYHLYQQLLQPIEEYIKEKKKLIVIPSAWIYYIPFEALIPSDEILGFSDLNFLIKQFDISYHYSSTLFAKTRRSKLKGNLSMYAFAPVYDSGEESERLVSPQSSNLRALDENSTFGPLPESEKEVKALKRLFEKKNKDVKVALRKEANEQELKKNLEKTFQFIHIAGHSFADTDNPDFSGIACYESENEDGILYLGEINYLNMKADLITLSSCESGFGKLNFAEGLLGLNRAFMYAGCPNVVFSLWKVYDKVSANLMVDFYESVLEGKSYSESLRQAKLALLEKESTANPHFWAPYLLIGR